MAEKPQVGATPGTTAPEAPQEVDALFKLQVTVSEFFIANVKYLGYAVGAALLVALVYGVWAEWRTSRADADYAAIAAIDYKMPKLDQMAQMGLAPMDDPSDTARLKNVEEGARRYRAAAAAARGSAAILGYMRAADAWDRVNKPDEALADLKAAWDLGQPDLPGYAAASKYATRLAGAGKTEEAIAVLREESVREKGLFAEEALIELAQLYVDAGRVDEAKNVVSEFQTRFPDSPRTARLAALSAGAGAAK